MRRLLPICTLATAHVAAVALLWAVRPLALGEAGDLARWAAAGDVEAVIGAVLWTAAFAGATWVLATTVGYVGVRSLGAPAWALGVAGKLALPVARRCTERAVAVSTAALIAAGPGPVLAAEVDPPDAIAIADPAVPSGPATVPVAGLGIPDVLPPGVEGPPSIGGRPDPVPESTEPMASAPRHVVVTVGPGDNLWVLAARHLAGNGRPTDPRGVHAYWLRVLEANAGDLTSGDPDLVHPGEVVVLPALD